MDHPLYQGQLTVVNASSRLAVGISDTSSALNALRSDYHPLGSMNYANSLAAYSVTRPDYIYVYTDTDGAKTYAHAGIVETVKPVVTTIYPTPTHAVFKGL